MLSCIFPGQGSQYLGMGAELFAEFSDLSDQASEELGYCIKTLCVEDPHKLLNQTQFTQPAIYTVNTLYFYKKFSSLNSIDFVAGHSLGEYNALLAAGVFDFITGLKLVKKRAELMQQASDGSMAVVIGLTSDQVIDILAANKLHTTTIANYNSKIQNVISGQAADINRAQECFKLEGVRIIPLRVSGAFHTQHMQSAADLYAEYLKDIVFATPKLPIIANYNVDFYHPANTKENLTNHINNPVYWQQTIEWLMAQGKMTFEEVGPGNVLTGLLPRNQQ